MVPPSQPMRSEPDLSAGDEHPTVVFPAPAPGPSSELNSVAPTLASSDQCANCGGSLAPDQNYCLNCGERRGAARFSSIPATGGQTAAIITEERIAPRPPRFSSAATLIAGVATLLIAMGIGVYIGGLGKTTSTNSGRAQIVTVNGGGAVAPTASSATTAAATGGSGSHGKQKSGGSHKGSSGPKVVTTVKNLPPPTVTVGAKGSGKGYQGGKFTGHFFGP